MDYYLSCSAIKTEGRKQMSRPTVLIVEWG